MKKFKYPLLIQGTKEELTKMELGLIKLGYYSLFPLNKYDENFEYHSIVTNYNNNQNEYAIDITGFHQGKRVVNASNQGLVLTLAAMVDDDKIYVGELWDVGGVWFSVSENNVKYINQILSKTRKATMYEIISCYETKHTMEKKIIGYKVITNFLTWPCGTVLKEIEFNRWGPMTHPDLSVTLSIVKNTDLFEPIYEQEIKKITLRCEGGTFEVEVSEKGVFYKPDGVYLNVYDLRQTIGPLQMLVTKHEKTNQHPLDKYAFRYSHVDSGCMKGVPLSDWTKVLDAYDDFKR